MSKTSNSILMSMNNSQDSEQRHDQGQINNLYSIRKINSLGKNGIRNLPAAEQRQRLKKYSLHDINHSRSPLPMVKLREGSLSTGRHLYSPS